MSEYQLRLRNVSHGYREGENRLQILDGADLDVKAGELVALVAPSGAGKSTLLHLGGLLERPQVGKVEICGEETSVLADRVRTQLRRRTIGFVYQFHHLLPEFTALENVAMPLHISGVPLRQANERAMDLLERLGVGQRSSHRPTELSGGEQQRVAIARAAANHPQIILADEPTGNLDPATSTLVFDALVELMREQQSCVLFVTHDHSLAKRADRVITLDQGKIIPFEF